MKYSLLFKIFIFSNFMFTAYGQDMKSVALIFTPTYNNDKIVINQNYTLNAAQETISFSIAKFYLSNFKFYENDKLVYRSTKNGFLIDLENSKTLRQKIEIPSDLSFDYIEFYFGIDDKINKEGISDGDLDPSNGMYWSWQSGYINMKLEGIFNKNNEFQFHLGGFLPPYAAFQSVALKVYDQNSVVVNVDFNQFIDAILWNENTKIMSPSAKAVELSKIAAKMFSIK